MNTTCADRDCGKPVTSTTLCADHTTELATLLHQTGWVLDQLRVALARQNRFSIGRAGTSGETPTPYNAAAADATVEYATTITRWQAKIADHIGSPVRYPNPIAASLWIDANLHRLAAFVDAGKMLNDLDRAHDAALRAINKAADTWFAGTCSAVVPGAEHGRTTCPCDCHRHDRDCTIPGGCDAAWDERGGGECQRDLYASSETGIIKCALCGTQHQIEKRRGVLIESALDHLATATEIARAVVVWSDYERGENLLVKRISEWDRRKRLQHRGSAIIHGRARPLYRVGDVIDLLGGLTQLTGTSQPESPAKVG